MYIEPLTTPIAIIDKTPRVDVDYCQAFITAIFAVVSGFILYVIKTIIDEYILRIYREYKKLKADISYTMIMYANVYTNGLQHCDLTDEASKALRNCAARLGSLVEELPRIHVGIPNEKKLIEAHRELIGLSNRVCSDYAYSIYDDIRENEKAEKTIKEILKLKNI